MDRATLMVFWGREDASGLADRICGSLYGLIPMVSYTDVVMLGTWSLGDLIGQVVSYMVSGAGFGNLYRILFDGNEETKVLVLIYLV